MGKLLAVSLVLFVAVFTPVVRAQGDSPYEPFSPDQLDNLLAPIALYPDPLLAQVLVAATFPDQVDAAGRFARDPRYVDDLDGQDWDVSVKAVAHYPTVIAMMADKLDWTTALGQAYAYQSTDVMASIQRLRAQARSAGNLVTTSQLQVVDSGGEIELWPAQPQYIYVPQYDPAIVYFGRAPLFFGASFFIGAWLNYDFDWDRHRIFYHGWEGGHGGWIDRSRQYIHPTNVYVNNTYRNVVVNRPVIHQPLNYGALNRYDDIHRTTNFNNFRGNNRVVNQPNPRGNNQVVTPPRFDLNNRVGTQPPPRPAYVPVPNKIINRNLDPTDRRINDYRGRLPQPPVQVRVPPPPAFPPAARGNFDPRVTSQRGQISRALVRPPQAPVVRRDVAKPPVRQEKPKKDGDKH
jgi:hypothetical protein